MTHESTDESGKEERLNTILAEYFQAFEAGQTPDKEAFIDRYSEFAAELEEFFADKQRFDLFAGQFQSAGPAEEPTIDPGGSSAPVPGTKVRYFGDYELLEEIARGGMGVVYKARQVSLNRTVALKMILAGQLASEEDLKRFHAEAEAAATLDHPGIVPIYEVGIHEGQHYFSMGYVEGESLAARLSAGPMAAREAAELTRRVTQAVAYAHNDGVIHRDLKPSNVLLDRDGQPRITDFGLARRVEGDSDLTATGQVLGTPSYMPPEQAEAKLGQVRETADVYALGAILYTLLAGRPPFQADNPLDTLRQVIDQDPVSPRQLNSQVPRDLETICLKCLEKGRRRRYGSARELADELQRFLDGEPIQARPIGTLARGWRWCRRKPLLAGLSALVAASLVVGTSVSTYFAIEANRQAREALRQQGRANREAADAKRERDRAKDHLDLARRRSYVSDMRLAQRAWEEGHLGRLAELLDAHTPQQDQSQDLRGFEWYYWHRLNNFDLTTVGGDVFSPDGKLMAWAASGGVRVWDVARGKAVLAFKTSGQEERQPDPVFLRLSSGPSEQYTNISFSPDSRRIATASKSTIKIWDLTSRELTTLEGHKAEINWVAFSPDGKWLASGGNAAGSVDGVPGELKLWDATAGRFVRDLKAHKDWITCVAFSPDSRLLASGGWDYSVRIWDVASGREIRALEDPPGVVNSVAFSPVGNRLAAAHDEGTVMVWDADTGRKLLTLEGHADSVGCVAFSPDGRRLASASALLLEEGSGAVKVWDVAQGRELFTLKLEGSGTVAFSPDGKLLSAGGKLWDATADPQPLVCRGHRQKVEDAAFSPDGRLLASVGEVDGRLKVWDAISGQEMLDLKDGFSDSVAFSPDGKRLTAAHGAGVFLCDPLTGQKIRKFKGHTGGVMTVAFSPDGKLLASGCQPDSEGYAGEIIIWEAASGRRLRTIDDPFAWHVVFSPDGKRLASARWDETVVVWDVASGKECLTLRGHTDRVCGVAFSPDGKLLASASEDHTVKLWDAAGGREVATLKGHATWVQGVVFSPDGRRLATAAGGSLESGEVIVWDVASGQELMSFGQAHGFSCVTFSRDGRRLAAGTQKALLVWDTRPMDEQRRLEQRAVSFYRQIVDESWSREQVVERVRRAPAISGAASRMALAWAERYPEDPVKLAKASWDVARRAGQPAEAYQQALRWAETAVRKEAVNQEPGRITTIYINCLAARGAAQYRLGQYRAALESLEEGSPLWRPADEMTRLALMAMSYHRLGEHDEAEAELKRLQEMMKDAKLAQDEVAKAVLREAEAVVGESETGRKPGSEE